MSSVYVYRDRNTGRPILVAQRRVAHDVLVLVYSETRAHFALLSSAVDVPASAVPLQVTLALRPSLFDTLESWREDLQRALVWGDRYSHLLPSIDNPAAHD